MGGQLMPNVARKVASTAASYAARNVLGPYGNAAITAFKVGRQAYRGYKYLRGKSRASKKMASQGTQTSSGAKWQGRSTGVYAGPFARTRKNKKTPESEALAKGYHITQEYYGRIEDPHCVYVAHSTYTRVPLMDAVVGAAVRKLFAKAGHDLPSGKTELPLFSPTNSDGFIIVYSEFGGTDGGQADPITVTIADDATFESVIGQLNGVVGRMASFLDNDGLNNNEPYMLSLYLTDRNVAATNTRLVSSFLFQNEYFDINVTSKLTIQNRTSAANATEGSKYEIDRVDNQPLKGVIYDFKHGEPRLKNLVTSTTATIPTNVLLNTIQTNGIQLVRSAELIGTTYQEPPNPKLWVNCAKSVKVVLQPGTMKTSIVKYVYKGKFTTLVKQLRVTRSQGSVRYGCYGRSQMIALEELLRTTTLNPITLQYERELKIACVSKTKKDNTFTTVLGVSELNSLP